MWRQGLVKTPWCATFLKLATWLLSSGLAKESVIGWVYLLLSFVMITRTKGGRTRPSGDRTDRYRTVFQGDRIESAHDLRHQERRNMRGLQAIIGALSCRLMADLRLTEPFWIRISSRIRNFHKVPKWFWWTGNNAIFKNSFRETQSRLDKEGSNQRQTLRQGWQGPGYRPGPPTAPLPPPPCPPPREAE